MPVELTTLDRIITTSADGKNIFISLPTFVGTGATWGDINGTLSDQTDLQEALDNLDNRIAHEEGAVQRLVNTGSPTAILATDGIILFDSNAATIAISLPAASIGKIKIPFKDVGANSSTNNITINRAGSDTIVDSAIAQTSTIIASNGFSGYFLSNGVDTWYLL